MRHVLVALGFLLVAGSSARATGILIPIDRKLPPLALVDQKVTINIDDQVAVTRIEQTFRNHTDRPLEATYLFPVPKGASVRKFTMWVNGVEQPGEIVEADKARKIYTDIVRRTLDPGLLEYMKNDLIKLRVFPVPAKGNQKISLSYTSIASSDNGLVEYMYPLRTEGKAAQTLEKFTINIDLKSQHSLTNIYSPSHPITIRRRNDHEATIGFEKNQAILDRDFQLFYQAGQKDIDLTAVAHRPQGDRNGYFMLLMSPRAELAKVQKVPRDFVYVIDTSGSMRGKRLTQAKNALKYCLANLSADDRFAMIHFASTVHKQTESLQQATKQNVDAARRWVDDLEATGGTAIDDALRTALAMRSSDDARTYTMVFFTDGQPTWGERNPSKIIENVKAKNTGNTRIFSFGVGDDVNTVLLDGLSDITKAVSTYVRESEDIEAKVSSLYSKITSPVLANLKLTVGDGVAFKEVYPPQLPDLFSGSQLVVFGRYSGKGHTTVTLTGTIGRETKEFVYEINFPDKTGDAKAFVEDLWARRKVGFLLDQIRLQGETKEVVDEVVLLAKRYGIATPYTSYLLVPDGPVARNGIPVRPGLGVGGMGMGMGMGGIQGGSMMGMGGMPGMSGGFVPPALMPIQTSASSPTASTIPPVKLEEFAKQLQKDPGKERASQESARLQNEAKMGDGKDKKAAETFADQMSSLDKAQYAWQNQQLYAVQNGKVGVDFAVHNNALRGQTQLTQNASRCVQNRNCIDVGGVWIDDGFAPKMETVTVKAMSAAYFRMLERHPEIRQVFQLGNYVVWVAPCGKALIIDQNAGLEEMPDADMDRLFVAAAKK